MLELRDKKYFIATEDGGVIGAYYDLEDAKIDAQDAWKSHNVDIRILEADHNHEVHDGVFLKVFKKLDWQPEEEKEEEPEQEKSEEKEKEGEQEKEEVEKEEEKPAEKEEPEAEDDKKDE